MTRAPRQGADLSALSELAPELADMLVSVACDIVMVLDQGGVIRNVSLGNSEAVAETATSWVGQHWTDTVTGSTRGKAAACLDDLASTGVSRLRHVAHSSAGSDVPIAYTAVRLGEHGMTLAVGRDLSVVSTMQERLVQSQRDLERDYWQHRQAETRYRLLFQVSTEAVVILDAATFNVLDANAAAARTLGLPVERIVGRPLVEVLPCTDLTSSLDSARDQARSMEGAASLGDGRGEVSFSVTPFRNEATAVLLVTLRGVTVAAPERAAKTGEDGIDEMFTNLVQRSADAVVVCTGAGRIALVNHAFRTLVQWPSSQPIDGCLLSELIGVGRARQDDATCAAILAQARREGSVGLRSASVRRCSGTVVNVELTAATLGRGDFVGFIIRVAHGSEALLVAAGDLSDRNLH